MESQKYTLYVRASDGRAQLPLNSEGIYFTKLPIERVIEIIKKYIHIAEDRWIHPYRELYEVIQPNGAVVVPDCLSRAQPGSTVGEGDLTRYLRGAIIDKKKAALRYSSDSLEGLVALAHEDEIEFNHEPIAK